MPRRNTWRLPDGTVDEGRSHFFGPEPLPDGAVPYIAPDRYYPSHRAVDFYHHWEEDIDLMAGMGFNVYRFSVCWSRIFPLGTEETPNEEGLAFYERVIDRLHERGIEPLITIYHDEMPVHLALENDGWSSRGTVDSYVRYCKALFERFGKKCK